MGMAYFFNFESPALLVLARQVDASIWSSFYASLWYRTVLAMKSVKSSNYGFIEY